MKDWVEKHKWHIENLNSKINKANFVNLCQTLYPKNREYIFFLSAHGTFMKRGYILGHKGNFNISSKVEIVWHIL